MAQKAQYVDKSLRAKMSGKHMNMPRTHANCAEVYGVGRPGKTEVDKSRGHIPYRKNRRKYDSKEDVWVKV